MMYIDLQDFIDNLSRFNKGRFTLVSFKNDSAGNTVKEYCCLGVLCELEKYPLTRVNNNMAWETGLDEGHSPYNTVTLPPEVKKKYNFDETLGKYPELAKAFGVIYDIRPYANDVSIEWALMRINDAAVDWTNVENFLNSLNRERRALNRIEASESLKEEVNAETNNDSGNSGIGQEYVDQGTSIPWSW